MNEEWFELKLTEEYQAEILKTKYPNLEYMRLIGPKKSDIPYVEIFHCKECPICEDQCSIHINKDIYALHDSIYGDAERIDEEFLYLAVAIGGKIFKDANEITDNFRIKL